MLAEVFQTAPGTIVSNHLEGRFGARGPRASFLVECQPWSDLADHRAATPTAPRGPFANTEVQVFDGIDLVRYAVDWMSSRFAPIVSIVRA